MSKLELPEVSKPAKHWQFVGLSLEGVVLNYNHPDYDNMSLHYEMLSDEAKTAFNDLRVVDDSEFGVLFVDLDEYEHKTELLTLIAALEA